MKNGCPNQASKQLKPNGQMKRMVAMTKKDRGERGMGKNLLLPPDRKLYMVTVSDSVQCDKGWKRVIHAHSTNHTMMLTATGQKTLTKYQHAFFIFF